MQKFRASMEPFWDLKFGEYVEYLTRVSSEYLTSSVLPSLTSSNGWTSCVLLADVIPWIYVDSPALYIARTMSMSSMPTRPIWSCTALLSSSSVIEALKLVTIICHSQTPDVDSVPTIMTTFTTHHFRYAATENMVKFSLLCIHSDYPSAHCKSEPAKANHSLLMANICPIIIFNDSDVNTWTTLFEFSPRGNTAVNLLSKHFCCCTRQWKLNCKVYYNEILKQNTWQFWLCMCIGWVDD